ncbi:GGDEF domain-containing protein [Paraglaciecola aquimarina]|uniref:diguanylate cyclase n=1 Tax=Paraglaciecola aquimarina TaxID=1235557 RepID=A0ABU3SZ02_9ALTE|nr:GGDEF domain-containing protein [Paraglaciecola aquimarina]MDU0355241.1 GGDEF domain-containing protein [Paraglaciecola aquimarina]
MTKWLTALPWLNYVTLLIAAGIALQFGRSRLVYCCILLALFLPAINQYLSAYPLYFEVRQYFLLLAISWLMLGRDRGFSRINILFSAITWLVIALISWLISTQLVDRAVPLLAPLQQPLASLIPQIGSQISVFEYLFFCLLALIGFGRFMYKCDNNHNALFITLLLIVPLQLTNDAVWMQLILLCLTALYCYAVIKDSFTMAFKDELTTIPSRRALMQYVQTLGRKYTVVMSDIDHFKKFNDTYGHDVGDEVLKLVASKLYKVTGR